MFKLAELNGLKIFKMSQKKRILASNHISLFRLFSNSGCLDLSSHDRKIRTFQHSIITSMNSIEEMIGIGMKIGMKMFQISSLPTP